MNTDLVSGFSERINRKITLKCSSLKNKTVKKVNRKYYNIIHKINPKTNTVFFILSTGRCGSGYLSHILNLAPNGVVEHEPQPGAESINHIGLDAFYANRSRFEAIEVEESKILSEHADVFARHRTEIYGDGYNSLYPFALAFRRHYRKRNIKTRFIHLMRHPKDCCPAILRAEGPFGIGRRTNFGLRAPALRQAESPAHAAANIWVKINEVISYQIELLEAEEPGSTAQSRLEKFGLIGHVRELYDWIGLRWPEGDVVRKELENSQRSGKRNSYKDWLNRQGVPRVTEREKAVMAELTRPYLAMYGYA